MVCRKPTIKIIDSVMGSGKSSFLIQELRDKPSKPVIIVTPYKSEIARFKSALPHLHEPTRRSGESSKIPDLKRLIEQGKSIITSHKLMQNWDRDVFTALKAHPFYELFIDEEPVVVTPLGNSKCDLRLLRESGMIEIVSEGRLNRVVVKDRSYSGYLDRMLTVMRSGSVYVNANDECVKLATRKVFESFRHVTVMTYMFRGGLLDAYCRLHRWEVSLCSVIRGQDGKYYTGEWMPYSGDFNHLIDISQNRKLNDVGNGRALTKSWYTDTKHRTNGLKALRNNTYNYFTNKLKASSKEIMWTTFEDEKSGRRKLKIRSALERPPFKSVGKITKDVSAEEAKRRQCFVACNERATNVYSDRWALAYLCNRYTNPVILRFFKGVNIAIDQDLFALSELVQWIWRSRIRREDLSDEERKVCLYIPSERMRALLIGWLNGSLSQPLAVAQ